MAADTNKSVLFVRASTCNSAACRHKQGCAVCQGINLHGSWVGAQLEYAVYDGIKLHASAGDKFALNDDQEGQEHLLTHMGRSLGAADMHEVILTYAVNWLPVCV